MDRPRSLTVEESMARTTDQLLQMVTIHLGDQEFAIDIMRCMEILRMEPITRVPRAPSFIEGVLSLRGNIIPCVDLRRRFGMPAAKTTRRTRIVVVDVHAGGDEKSVARAEQLVGLIADDAGLRVRVPRRSIQAAPEMVAGFDGRYLRGVYEYEGRMVLVLDVDFVFSPGELARLAELEGGPD
jgi:purine-binding chemotaxis protein CheW